MFARAGVDSILNLLFPPACAVCGAPPAHGHPLCGECSRTLDLLRAAPACPRCGLTPGPYLNPEGRCSACRLARPGFDGTCRAAPYAGAALALLHRYKYQGGEHMDMFMVELMARAVRQCAWRGEIDVVTAVPAHWYRRLTVRFHPAAVLGRGVARMLRLPYARLVRRVRLDRHQIGMSPARRRANVQGAFRATTHLDGLKVCVVDDVMTSGSTLDEVARTLKACGARRVWNLVWARSTFKHLTRSCKESSMKLTLEAVADARRRSKLWIIPIFEGRLNAAAAAYGLDPKVPRAWGFEGKSDQSLPLAVDNGRRQGLLIGAGAADKFDAEAARRLVARAVRHGALRAASGSNGTLAAMFAAEPLASAKVPAPVLVEALAEGAALGGYSFTQLKAKGTEASALPSFPDRLTIAIPEVGRSERERFRDGMIMAKWTLWARDLLNLSQSHIDAGALATRARAAARNIKGVRCTVLGPREIAARNMGLLLAVNQGSGAPARFIILEYRGAAARQPPVCLVGKAVTFDTGGYNMKPGDSMRGMHMDKGGGIAALASFFAATELGIRRNLVCLVPSTDNRVSGKAMCPGDVYVGASGISVEVDNTDAEGRLILADALAYAGRYKPSHVLDMATLTGAAVVALGDQATAMFCNDDALAAELLQHGAEAGELIWRLPLWAEYESKLKSTTADLKNVGGRWGGAVTAALFLQRFVPEGVKWCHLDMAGKMRAEEDQPYTPAGCGHGFGPRLLGRWLRSMV